MFEGGFAGALITALTGIEIALWDLKGKALEVPIYELMGGKFRDKIRVYADCQVEPGMNFAEIQRVVDDVLERGFTALKIDLDIHAYGHHGSEVTDFVKDPFNDTANQWEHERMVRAGRDGDAGGRARRRGGADVHTRLDVPSAIRLARDLEPYHLMWLEEPVPAENVAAMREVKESTTTPICAGENLYLRHGFRDLIEQQAVDIIMPDIPKCGGLSECRKIANMAEIYYMPFAPHNVASPIGTMASAHVCATVPNFLVLEFHWLHQGLLDDDHQGEDRYHPGRLHHPDGSPRHRAGAGRGGRAAAPVSGHDLVQVGKTSPWTHRGPAARRRGRREKKHQTLRPLRLRGEPNAIDLVHDLVYYVRGGAG